RMRGERQVVVYEMRLASSGDLAMVLPLPIQRPSDDAVKFIDLSSYPEFFDDLERCFPVPVSRGSAGWAVAAAGQLEVHRVGAFDASFVPTRADFGRLDSRFRLTDDVWRQLPDYEDFGFAVFQLRAGDARVHPMALSFLTRHPETLFFPTAHVHDGTVHPTAHFDHALYAQGELALADWVPGSVLPGAVMNFGNLLI